LKGQHHSSNRLLDFDGRRPLARQSLLSEKTDMALAGAVSVRVLIAPVIF